MDETWHNGLVSLRAFKWKWKQTPHRIVVETVCLGRDAFTLGDDRWRNNYLLTENCYGSMLAIGGGIRRWHCRRYRSIDYYMIDSSQGLIDHSTSFGQTVHRSVYRKLPLVLDTGKSIEKWLRSNLWCRLEWSDPFNICFALLSFGASNSVWMCVFVCGSCFVILSFVAGGCHCRTSFD